MLCFLLIALAAEPLSVAVPTTGLRVVAPPAADPSTMQPRPQTAQPSANAATEDWTPALARLAWEATRNPNPQRRCEAVEQLGRVPTDAKRLAAILSTVRMQDPDPMVKMVADRTLTQMLWERKRLERIAESRSPSLGVAFDNRPYREAWYALDRNGVPAPTASEMAAAQTPSLNTQASEPIRQTAAAAVAALPAPPPALESPKPPAVEAPATQRQLVEKVEGAKRSDADSALPTRTQAPTDPKERKREADEWLRYGREHVRAGRLAEAESALEYVNALGASYGVFEYRPAALARDIAKAKSAKSK